MYAKINNLDAALEAADVFVTVNDRALYHAFLEAMEKYCIEKSILIYSEFFYKFDLSKVTDLYKNREEVLNSIKKILGIKDTSEKEILLLNDMEHNLEILIDLTEARMGLEY